MANLFKIAGNFMIMSAVETLGEAFALLRKGGVDADLFLDTMTEGLFAAPVYKNYGKQILTEAYEPAGFYLKLGLKDANLVQRRLRRTWACRCRCWIWCAATTKRR